jgi:photoactive yellow protein
MNTPPAFDDVRLFEALQAMDATELDTLPYGVIGFDGAGHVVRYNRTEAQAALFDAAQVIGLHVFIELAPCLNNYLVAGRFEDQAKAGDTLDTVLPWVLTFRMRPTPARLRLLARPGAATHYVLVQRSGGGA